jgi:hypothetical protein
MYSVVYISSAIQEFSNEDLVDLLTVARRNNLATQITGMLLYSGGNFIQVLEGERSAVELAYARIAVDLRHRSVMRLLEQHIESRQFANWSMGFSTASDLSADLQQNFSTLLQQGRDATIKRDNRSTVWKLLLQFRNSMR